MNFKDCLEIATEAHKGQKRKFSNEDYINHPIRVANQLIHLNMQCIAILHDVLEDTSVTIEELELKGIPKRIIDVVTILTKLPGENYYMYIMRINLNREARIIKIEDLNDNLRDLRRGSMKDKYLLARHLLMNP